MTKTIRYVIAIVVLLAVNLGLVFTEDTQSSSSFDDELFLIENIDQIQSVIITRGDVKIELTKNDAAWRLNDRFEADQNFMQILFSLLSQVKVKRTIGALDQEVSGNVIISFNGESNSFGFASDPLGTRSYFIKGGIAYQVEVPGYRDNVVNIFQLSEDQWRDRVVFDGSWRTIQNLRLTSTGGQLVIRFSNQFFEVDGIAKIDSSGVVDYLNQFQVFQANEMISEGRFPELDSLKSTNPLAILSIEDIQDSNEILFKIYPSLDGQPYHLVTKNDQSMMVFDKRRIESILKSNEDFRVKETP